MAELIYSVCCCPGNKAGRAKPLPPTLFLRKLFFGKHTLPFDAVVGSTCGHCSYCTAFERFAKYNLALIVGEKQIIQGGFDLSVSFRGFNKFMGSIILNLSQAEVSG